MKIKLILILATLGIGLGYAQEPKKAGTVKTNGIDLYYEVYGEGEPLILLHGWAQSSQFWQEYIAEYAKNYEVYVIDLRGHGKTSTLTESFSLDVAANDVIALLENLNLKKVKAIGIDYGGNILLKIAGLRTERLESIILIGASNNYSRQDDQALNNNATFENLSEEEISELRKLHLLGDNQIKALFNPNLNYEIRLSNEELGLITTKALIINGDNDEILGVSAAIALHSNMPNSQLWIVQNSGHIPLNSTNKSDFLRTTNKFLASDKEILVDAPEPIIIPTPPPKQVSPKTKYEVLLSGRVKSYYTGMGINGATIFIESLDKGTYTNIEGYYEMVVPKGLFLTKIDHLNMREEILVLDITSDTTINVELKEDILKLDEITVFAETPDKNVVSLDVGKNNIDIKKLTSVPTFMGEPDVIKSLMLLPGVTTVGEGASGFNVRGGSVDQNLISQDGGLIFNPSHVFGFFSVFNPAIVNNATLYKGGIPAKYGGRLSSVLNIDLIEGDFREYHVEGGIGLVSSKLAINGPIIKNKLSFVIGGRISYSDWLLHQSNNLSLKNSTAAFQDFNVKLSYLLNDNNKIFYSGYLSHDTFGLATSPNDLATSIFDWATINHVLGWNHVFSENTSMNLNYAIGEYSYDIENEDTGFNSFHIDSKIDYQNIRAEITHAFNEKNNLNFGSEATFYWFEPGLQQPVGDSSGVERIELEHEKSIEFAVYAEDEFELSERFSVRGGLRFSLYQNLGPGTDYLYDPNDSKNVDNIIDTVTYQNNEKIAQYQGFEPRLNLNYKLTSASSLKASYNRTRQYLHLISNSTAVTPSDLWKTSNLYIPPEIGDQYSLGYFRNFLDNSIETSVELYYKQSTNVIDFKNGVELLMNQNIEADLIRGESEAYGIEFFVNKKMGKLTGWVSYTLSRSLRQFKGEFDDETINLGEQFPSNYDKPHDITLVMLYQSSPLVEFGLNFTYNTGRPTTAPETLYHISNLTNVFSYSLRNQERNPDYHRLDLSVTLKSKPKIDRKWRMSWTFAVYNVYGRKNAYSVFFKNDYGSPPQAYKLSVLGSIFPSVMVNFEF